VGKKKIIKKYEQLAPDMVSLIKATYPDGYEDKLISFQSPTGAFEIALPLETEEVSYLIKMPKSVLPDSDDDDDPVSDENEIGEFESLDAAEDIADED
jgi:hypothetical protein